MVHARRCNLVISEQISLTTSKCCCIFPSHPHLSERERAGEQNLGQYNTEQRINAFVCASLGASCPAGWMAAAREALSSAAGSPQGMGRRGMGATDASVRGGRPCVQKVSCCSSSARCADDGPTDHRRDASTWESRPRGCGAPLPSGTCSQPRACPALLLLLDVASPQCPVSSAFQLALSLHLSSFCCWTCD